MKETQNQRTSPLFSLAVVLGFLILTVLTGWFFLRLYKPPQRIAPVVPFEGYDRATM